MDLLVLIGGDVVTDLSPDDFHEKVMEAYELGIKHNELIGKIDFMKVDIEGGEVEVLNSITDQNLSTLRCLACEFHKTYDEFDIFQKEFGDRMGRLGFRSFTLYHGDGNLRTVNFWKE